MEKKIFINESKVKESVPLADYIRMVVKAEVAAQFERLETRISVIERDLILSKQQMVETVQIFSQTLELELNKLMDEQQEAMVMAAVQLIQDRLSNNE